MAIHKQDKEQKQVKTLKLEISDRAWKKLNSYATLKQLLGPESRTVSDLLLLKIVQAIENDECFLELKAKED